MILDGTWLATRQDRQTSGMCQASRERVRKTRVRKKGEGKDKDQDKEDNGAAKGSAQTGDSYFAGECGYCGEWGHKKKDQYHSPTKNNSHIVIIFVQELKIFLQKQKQQEFLVGGSSELITATDTAMIPCV